MIRNHGRETYHYASLTTWHLNWDMRNKIIKMKDEIKPGKRDFPKHKPQDDHMMIDVTQVQQESEGAFGERWPKEREGG